MGAIITKNNTFKSIDDLKTKSEIAIPLNEVNDHIRILQNATSNEVIVVLKNESDEANKLLADGRWFELIFSQDKQKEYYQATKLNVVIPQSQLNYAESSVSYETSNYNNNERTMAVSQSVTTISMSSQEKDSGENSMYENQATLPPMKAISRPLTNNIQTPIRSSANNQNEGNPAGPVPSNSAAAQALSNDEFIRDKLTTFRNAGTKEDYSFEFSESSSFNYSKGVIDYHADPKLDPNRKQVKERKYVPVPYTPRGPKGRADDKDYSNSLSQNISIIQLDNERQQHKDYKDNDCSSVYSDKSKSFRSGAHPPPSTNHSASISYNPINPHTTLNKFKVFNPITDDPLICQICEMKFYGYDCHEEHFKNCSILKELNITLHEINLPLIPMLEELAPLNPPDGKVNESDIIEKHIFSTVKYIQRVIALKENNGDISYIQHLQRKIDSEIEKIDVLIQECKVSPSVDSNVINKLSSCHFNLSRALAQLQEKLSVYIKHQYLIPTIHDYDILKTIGKGGFGMVVLARRKIDKKLCAIKIMPKEFLHKNKTERQVMRERRAMSFFNRQSMFFVQLYAAFQQAENLFMVLEYVPGGDCMTLLRRMNGNNGTFSETQAQHIVLQVCLAVKVLHENGAVHRDIKPDNILINRYGHAKLGDFGLIASYKDDEGIQPPSIKQNSHAVWDVSEHINESDSSASSHRSALLPSGIDFSNSNSMSSGSNSSFLFVIPTTEKRKKLNSRVGNYHYSCPEIVNNKSYDHTCDWWSVGVLLFHLLTNITPFEAKDPKETLENIRNCKSIHWGRFHGNRTIVNSQSCKAFLYSIFRANNEERLGFRSSDEVIKHDFFANVNLATMYEIAGPLYPQLNSAFLNSQMSSSSSSSFTVDDVPIFTLLPEDETNQIPTFYDTPYHGRDMETHPTMSNLDFENFEGFSWYQ